MNRWFLLFSLAGLAPVPAAVVLDDQFDNGVPATNNGAGYTIFQNDGLPATEAGSTVSWGPGAGWNWGGADFQSNNEYAFPSPGESYRVSWNTGPMAVTTPSATQTWGDIRMQFSIVSANLAQGASSSEMWPITQGLLTTDVIFKATGGNTVFVALAGKNDAQPANSNGTYVPGLVNNGIDVTVPNLIMMELTDADISLWVNGSLSTTVSLASLGMGGGAGEEFSNGWYPAFRAATVDDGRGTMSVDRMTVEFIPEPTAAGLLGALGMTALLRRRRRGK